MTLGNSNNINLSDAFLYYLWETQLQIERIQDFETKKGAITVEQDLISPPEEKKLYVFSTVSRGIGSGAELEKTKGCGPEKGRQPPARGPGGPVVGRTIRRGKLPWL